MTKKALKILFLAAEAVPFAKVGGLADVAGSLPKALRTLGHDVRLMIPRYGAIRSDQFSLNKIGDPFPVKIGGGEEHIHLIGSSLDVGTEMEVPVYLIWNESYFSSRDQIYGFEDDAQRFVLFGRGALAALQKMDWQPDVIHANDWHTGFVPAWLGTVGWREPAYRDIATLFTIHNLTYQGVSGRLILTFAHLEQLKHLEVEAPGTVNWMAQGIAHADLINTVSERYAQEILSPDMGMGLDPLLNARKDRLFGVVNGLDYDQWDPASDPHIPHNFDSQRIDQRSANKTALQQQARLPVRADAPLVGMVTRLDHVKGLGLMGPVLEWLIERDAQFVLLGSGDSDYHEMFEQFQSRYPSQVHAFLKFDPVLARRIYAGADLFLMPSAVEPCGLGQMIAMRYGCVPVVRAVGGLADTVADNTEMQGRGTGFTFTAFTPEACQEALQRALETYERDDAWRSVQQRGMRADFSWTVSAQKYVALYRKAIDLHNS
ncbi:MAG TPA: glycogen synthase [Chloroflexi bacterium]|nr:glycogen synthase [Chloroflexota bacterium]